MKTKMKELLEKVVLKEKDFKGDDGISHVPAPEFSAALPETDLDKHQEGEGKSKEAKNADLKGGVKHPPKKLSEEEDNTDGDVIVEDSKDELRKQLNTVTAEISYYKKNYNAGDKKGVAPSEELQRLYKKKDEIKKKMQRTENIGPKQMNNSFEVSKETLNVSEEISAIFDANDELTEEFKNQAKAIFESAVVVKANEVINAVIAEANANLEKTFAELDESFDVLHEDLVASLEENYEAKVEEISEKMNALTEKAIEEWKEENKVALTSKMKVDIAESFMTGLKDLFETHNIDVTTEKVDVTEALMAEVETLKEKLDKEIEANLSLKEEIEETKKKELVDDLSEGLTDVEKGKFQALSENIDYTSDEDFTAKLNQIKESFFAKKAEVIVNKIDDADDGIDLHEEATPKHDPAIEAMLAASRRFAKK